MPYDAGMDGGPKGKLVQGEGCWDRADEVGKDGPLFWGHGGYPNARRAITGISPGQSPASAHYQLTYVWFPKAPAGGGKAPDVAVVRTKEAYSGTTIPLMSASEMPTPGNIQSTYHGASVDVVGYSNWTFDMSVQEYAYRRHAPGAVHAPPGDAGSGAGSGNAYTVRMGAGTAVCSGDSGGPVLFSIGGTYKIGGVVASGVMGPDNCTTTTDFQAAYVQRAFVDELCRHGAWEDCTGTTDTDEDTKLDTGNPPDNCPRNPNQSQRNTNAAWENILHYGSALGDACDPYPNVTLDASKAVSGLDERGAPPQGGMVIEQVIVDNKARITYRPAGYAVLNELQPPYEPIDKVRIADVRARYCACHEATTTSEANPVVASDTRCKNVLCPHVDPMPTVSHLEDTGWLALRWQGCPPKDTDGNLRYNECEVHVSGVTHHRTNGQTAYCTDRDEWGCRAGDDLKRFWRQPGKTPSITWDWRAQDYPHNHNVLKNYNPTRTLNVKARVWLRPVHIKLGSLPSPAHSAFTEPKTLEWKAVITLGRPLYDPPRLRWLVPAWVDPDAALTGVRLLAPVRWDTPPAACPDAFNWNTPWQASDSATRGVISSRARLLHGELGQAFGGLALDSDPYHAPHTQGHAAAQHDDAVFVFGGEDRHGALSGDLWFGFAEPEAPHGALTYMRIGGGAMAQSGSGGGAGGAAKVAAAKAWKTWKTKHKAKKSRPGVTVLAARAKPKWEKAKKAVAPGGKTMMAFSQGPPSPQAESVFGLSPLWGTLTVFYGDTGGDPVSTDPVEVGIYDLEAETWTTGSVHWGATAGARRHAGYAMFDEFRLALFGGRHSGGVAGGLYLVNLDPELLMASHPPQHLDGLSVLAPAARTHAALGFDPVAGTAGKLFLWGGIDGEGQKLNDLWVFSVASGQWTRLCDGSGPGAPPAMVAAGLVVSALDGTPVVYAGTTSGAPDQGWGYRFTPGKGWQRLQRAEAEPFQHISAIKSPAISGCLEEDPAGKVSDATCSGEQAQGFHLRPLEADPGLHEIVRISDGKCLRLDGPLLWRQVGDRQCQYIAWQTPFSLGACGDARAHFDLVAWSGDDGYEVRQRFPCTKNGQPDGYDVGSCADTDTAGDKTLRVELCGGHQRQRMLAPGWPELE